MVGIKAIKIIIITTTTAIVIIIVIVDKLVGMATTMVVPAVRLEETIKTRTPTIIKQIPQM